MAQKGEFSHKVPPWCFLPSCQAYEVGVMITYNLQTFCIPPTDRYASKQVRATAHKEIIHIDMVGIATLPVPTPTLS